MLASNSWFSNNKLYLYVCEKVHVLCHGKNIRLKMQTRDKTRAINLYKLPHIVYLTVGHCKHYLIIFFSFASIFLN